MRSTIQSICVYCASSRQVDDIHVQAATRLGEMIARAGHTLVYGGGARGTMGTLADAALAQNGKVIGVMPAFMCELEWNHSGLSELILVDSLHARKQRMLDLSDAIVALPGGSGTLDELLEAISMKRLGLFTGPVVIVNTAGFYDNLIAQMELIIKQRFMDERHRNIWIVVDDAEDTLSAIYTAPAWSAEARHFAGV